MRFLALLALGAALLAGCSDGTVSASSVADYQKAGREAGDKVQSAQDADAGEW